MSIGSSGSGRGRNYMYVDTRTVAGMYKAICVHTGVHATYACIHTRVQYRQCTHNISCICIRTEIII